MEIVRPFYERVIRQVLSDLRNDLLRSSDFDEAAIDARVEELRRLWVLELESKGVFTGAVKIKQHLEADDKKVLKRKRKQDEQCKHTTQNNNSTTARKPQQPFVLPRINKPLTYSNFPDTDAQLTQSNNITSSSAANTSLNNGRDDDDSKFNDMTTTKINNNSNSSAAEPAAKRQRHMNNSSNSTTSALPQLESPHRQRVTYSSLLEPSFDPALLDAPLNSGDDDSDLAGAELSEPTANLILCQYEKVNHKKNKWHIQLKDGIMHLDGKDYVFKQATGELQW